MSTQPVKATGRITYPALTDDHRIQRRTLAITSLEQAAHVWTQARTELIVAGYGSSAVPWPTVNFDGRRYRLSWNAKHFNEIC